MTDANVSALVSRRDNSEIWYHRLSKLLPWTAFPWMIVSYVSIMAGGAPDAQLGPVIWFLLILLWTYPVTALVGAGIAKRFHRNGNHQRAVYILIAPAALGATIVALLFAPFAYGFLLFCTGQL